MSNYTYKSPTENGYKQFKLTKKQHNRLFKFRPKKWNNKFEYYYNDYGILLHNFTSVPAVMLGTILFPLSLLLYGLSNFKEVVKDHKDMLNQKKSGSFSVEHISSKSEMYDEIMKLIKKENENVQRTVFQNKRRFR